MSFNFTKEDKIDELHPNIKQFIGSFAKNRINEFDALIPAIEGGDMESIRLFCHKVTGIAASYNCYRLEELALYIQKHAREGSISTLKELIPIIRSYKDELNKHI